MSYQEKNKLTLFISLRVDKNGESVKVSKNLQSVECASSFRRSRTGPMFGNQHKEDQFYREVFVSKDLMDRIGYTHQFIEEYLGMLRDMNFSVYMKKNDDGTPLVLDGDLNEIVFGKGLHEDYIKKDAKGKFYVMIVGKDPAFGYESNLQYVSLAELTALRYLWHEYYVGIPEQAMYLYKIHMKKKWNIWKCFMLAHMTNNKTHTGYYALMRNPLCLPREDKYYTDKLNTPQGASSIHYLFCGFDDHNSLINITERVCFDNVTSNDNEKIEDWTFIKDKLKLLYDKRNFKRLFTFLQDINTGKITPANLVKSLRKIKVRKNKGSLITQAQEYYGITHDDPEAV